MDVEQRWWKYFSTRIDRYVKVYRFVVLDVGSRLEKKKFCKLLLLKTKSASLNSTEVVIFFNWIKKFL